MVESGWKEPAAMVEGRWKGPAFIVWQLCDFIELLLY